MSIDQTKVKRREALALTAIKNAYGTEESEYGVDLFVAHHIEEIEEEYWRKHLSKSKPEPKEVIGLLVLKSHWGVDDEEDLDTFDFTLPDETTNYVLCVSFDDGGEVTSIEMES